MFTATIIRMFRNVFGMSQDRAVANVVAGEPCAKHSRAAAVAACLAHYGDRGLKRRVRALVASAGWHGNLIPALASPLPVLASPRRMSRPFILAS